MPAPREAASRGTRRSGQKVTCRRPTREASARVETAERLESRVGLERLIESPMRALRHVAFIGAAACGDVGVFDEAGASLVASSWGPAPVVVRFDGRSCAACGAETSCPLEVASIGERFASSCSSGRSRTALEVVGGRLWQASLGLAGRRQGQASLGLAERRPGQASLGLAGRRPERRERDSRYEVVEEAIGRSSPGAWGERV